MWIIKQSRKFICVLQGKVFNEETIDSDDDEVLFPEITVENLSSIVADLGVINNKIKKIKCVINELQKDNVK